MRAGLLCSLALALLLHAAPAMADAAKIDFWSEPRKGANMMNQVQTEADLAAAAALGIQFIRLAPDKWKSAGHDFLIGTPITTPASCPRTSRSSSRFSAGRRSIA